MAAATAVRPAPDVRMGAWFLTKLGVCSAQLHTLLATAGRLETHVPHPVLHAPPPPFTGTAEQEEVSACSGEAGSSC